MQMKDIKSLHIAGIKFSRSSKIKARCKHMAVMYYYPSTGAGGSSVSNEKSDTLELLMAEPFDSGRYGMFYPVVARYDVGSGVEHNMVYWILKQDVLEIVGGVIKALYRRISRHFNHLESGVVA